MIKLVSVDGYDNRSFLGGRANVLEMRERRERERESGKWG
jgi:hypothetical protein